MRGRLVPALRREGCYDRGDEASPGPLGLQPLVGSIKGFVSYTLARSGSGGFSVTVCQDQAGIDESVQKAKDWIAKNAGTGAAAPEVSTGEVIVHLK